VLDQAIGLALYDGERYATLARTASRQYLPTLISLCPPAWPEARELDVAELILATLRGFLVDWRTHRRPGRHRGGFSRADQGTHPSWTPRRSAEEFAGSPVRQFVVHGSPQ
jgi:hypothetical protein